MVGEMETKEKPKPTPDYLMQLMNDKKLMSSLPNFCGIFNHLERLLDEGESNIYIYIYIYVFFKQLISFMLVGTADAFRFILNMLFFCFLVVVNKL
uniref:STAR protein homodimerisation region domain-containing protein n=1 Tax=Sinocyclocheilus grahami TaxID=75366 RepID=A0A672LZ79_SINGR